MRALVHEFRSVAGGLTAVVDDTAVPHAHDALRGVGDGLIVGDEQDRLAAGVQPSEQLQDFLATFRVERAGRFVGQQQRRLVGQRSGDGQPLALPAGERRGGLLGLVADAQQVEQVACPGFGQLALAPGDEAGISTFSSAVMPSRRLKNWNTMPMCWRRMIASSLSVLPTSDSPATDTSPSSGTSSPATMLSSVDLPQPEGPMTATNSPRCRCRGRRRAGRARVQCLARRCGTPG